MPHVRNPRVTGERWHLSTGSRHTLFLTPPVRTNGLHHYWSGKYRRCPECEAARLKFPALQARKNPKRATEKENNWTASSQMYGEKRTFSRTQRPSLPPESLVRGRKAAAKAKRQLYLQLLRQRPLDPPPRVSARLKLWITSGHLFPFPILAHIPLAAGNW